MAFFAPNLVDYFPGIVRSSGFILSAVAMSGGGFSLPSASAVSWRREGNMQLPAVELKGKPLSLGAKITGALVAVTALAMKATVSPLLDIDAAIKVVAFVVLVFAPIDVSMWMKNVFTPIANAKSNYTRPYAAPQSYDVTEAGYGK
jgi:hypothetical protein